MWLALGSVPVESQAQEKAASCETCAKSSGDCPHCAAGEKCPHCDEAKTCPHCGKSKSCSHCGSRGHHGHHGKWGSHKWDYKCVRPPKKPGEMTTQFKALGEQGWKLSGVDNGIWCFTKMKR
jgi:hypothetical protein